MTAWSLVFSRMEWTQLLLGELVLASDPEILAYVAPSSLAWHFPHFLVLVGSPKQLAPFILVFCRMLVFPLSCGDS